MSSCSKCSELERKLEQTEQQVTSLQLIVRKNTATKSQPQSPSTTNTTSGSSESQLQIARLEQEKSDLQLRIATLETRVTELTASLETAAAFASGQNNLTVTSGLSGKLHHHASGASSRVGSATNSANVSPSLAPRARPGSDKAVADSALELKSMTLPSKSHSGSPDSFSTRRAQREAEREDERKRREEERAARKKHEEDESALRAEMREKRRQERSLARAANEDAAAAAGDLTPSAPASAIPSAASSLVSLASVDDAATATAAANALTVTDVPPRITMLFGRSEHTVDLDIKATDTIGTLRRRLFDEKLVPPDWAAKRSGGGRYTQSDVLIGKMNDAKFEPHPARRTMYDLRYELHAYAKLVVHVRPSIPLLPAGVRAPDVALRVKAALAESVGISDANQKVSDSLAKRVARRSGASAPTSPLAIRSASAAAALLATPTTTVRSGERSKWLPVSEVLPYAEVAIKWEWSVADDEWHHSVVLVLVDARPFSEGQLRQAFYCRVLSDASRGYVAKFAKNEREPRRTYFEDVRMQTIASDLALRFNEAKPPKLVEVVQAAVLEFPYRGANEGDDVRRVCGLEAAIEGVSVDTPFRKYNNNTGWKTEQGVRNTPQAFSHFTYESSEKQMIVVDIQGVARVDGDVYTDPQIHSVGGVGFGVGNHGKAGMEQFLLSHTCNAVCQFLNLPTVTSSQPKTVTSVLNSGEKGGTEPKPVLKL